jgi:hypothetical protein
MVGRGVTTLTLCPANVSRGGGTWNDHDFDVFDGERCVAVPLLYNDPEHWRTRAQEVRELACKMTDSEGKGSMLGIAENYDRLAARAIERLSEGPPRH